MGKSQREYRYLLQSLLPRGAFWTRDENATLTEVLEGFAAELSRVEGRSEDLILESMPSTVTELLEEWEEEYSIPDPGFSLGATTEERREVIKVKFIAVGQQDKGYFEDIAAALGYTVSITEFPKCLAGIATAGESTPNSDYSVFYWFIDIDVSVAMMEFYTKANISQLVYDITKRKPGHTMVFFRFTGVEFDMGFSNAFDSQPWYDGSSWPLSFDSEFSSAFANNTDYDGVRLVGAFDRQFGNGFDVKRGGDFNFDEFGDGFDKPS